jgi:glucokinase
MYFSRVTNIAAACINTAVLLFHCDILRYIITMAKKTTYLLTGDIGGTNSRMSLYTVDDEEHLVVKYFRNEEHLPKAIRGDPTAFQKYIIIPFLQFCWETAQLAPLEDCEIIACLATAGLVTSNGVRMTNFDNLLVDGAAIEQDNENEYLRCIIACRVINDFVAQGFGVLTLKPSEVRVLYGPATTPDAIVGPKVCVGAGTGLGECFLIPNDDGKIKPTYSCFPSEGGHVEYAPRNDLEVKMWTFLSQKFSSKRRISVERVVSGTGLANVYDFLSNEFPDRVDPTVHQKFLQAKDEQGKVVAENSQSLGSLCRDAMDIMMSAYGCEVGSAAIKWIPTGGLFVTGGLTPKNIEHIEGKDTRFMKSYLHKGRVSSLLEKIPLFAVMVEDLGVRGAHKAALMEYDRFRSGKVDSPAASTKRQKHQVALSLVVAAVVGFSIGVLVNTKRK